MRLDFASKSASISDFDNENKATSAPEISAEQNKSKNNSKYPEATEKSIATNKLIKLVGSGSKSLSFS